MLHKKKQDFAMAALMMEIHRLSRTQAMYLYLLAWYILIALYHSLEFYQ